MACWLSTRVPSQSKITSFIGAAYSTGLRAGQVAATGYDAANAQC
jgi:hypothetical protein